MPVNRPINVLLDKSLGESTKADAPAATPKSDSSAQSSFVPALPRPLNDNESYTAPHPPPPDLQSSCARQSRLQDRPCLLSSRVLRPGSRKPFRCPRTRSTKQIPLSRSAHPHGNSPTAAVKDHQSRRYRRPATPPSAGTAQKPCPTR